MTTRLLSSTLTIGAIVATALSLGACGSSPGCRAATGAGLGAAGGAAIGAAAGNPLAGAVAGGVAGAAVGGTTSPSTVSAGPGPC